MASDIQIKGWMTTDQAADTLGLKPDTVRRYANRGTLRSGRKLGNYLLFAQSEVARFAREKREAGNPNFTKK